MTKTGFSMRQRKYMYNVQTPMSALMVCFYFITFVLASFHKKIWTNMNFNYLIVNCVLVNQPVPKSFNDDLSYFLTYELLDLSNNLIAVGAP